MTPLVIIALVFVAYYAVRSYFCSCMTPMVNRSYHCVSTKFMGMDLANFLFYALIGFLCPDQFVFWQVVGVTYELVQTLPKGKYLKAGCDRYPDCNNCKSCNDCTTCEYSLNMPDLYMNIIGFVVGAGVRLGL